jgi:hypothetical protein
MPSYEYYILSGNKRKYRNKRIISFYFHLLKGIKSPQVLWLFRIIVSVTVMNQYSAW